MLRKHPERCLLIRTQETCEKNFYNSLETADMQFMIGAAEFGPVNRYNFFKLFSACSGLFGLVASGIKSQGIILVELQEIYTEYSAESILWLFSMALLVQGLSG